MATPKRTYWPEEQRRFLVLRATGILLIVEAVLGAVLGVYMTPFAGVGVLGIAGAAAIGYSGVTVLTLRRNVFGLAALVAALGAGPLAVPPFVILLFSNCGIMGGDCTPGSELIFFGWPVALILLNWAICVIVLLNRQSTPP